MFWHDKNCIIIGLVTLLGSIISVIFSGTSATVLQNNNICLRENFTIIFFYWLRHKTSATIITRYRRNDRYFRSRGKCGNHYFVFGVELPIPVPKVLSQKKTFLNSQYVSFFFLQQFKFPILLSTVCVGGESTYWLHT